MTVDQLKTALPDISKVLVAAAVKEPMRLLKQVADVPRMYRRTNRQSQSYCSTVECKATVKFLRL